MTGWSIPIAALGEPEAEVEVAVLVPVPDDFDPVAPEVALDPDLPVVFVALGEPVLTVPLLPPDGTMMPPETEEPGRRAVTRVVFA